MNYKFVRTVWRDKDFQNNIWTGTGINYALEVGLLNPGTIIQRCTQNKKTLKEYYLVVGKRGSFQELIDVPPRYMVKKKAKQGMQFSVCRYCGNRGAYTPANTSKVRCKYCEMEWIV